MRQHLKERILNIYPQHKRQYGERWRSGSVVALLNNVLAPDARVIAQHRYSRPKIPLKVRPARKISPTACNATSRLGAPTRNG